MLEQPNATEPLINQSQHATVAQASKALLTFEHFSLSEFLALAVKVGLLDFWRSALPTDSPVPDLLAMDIKRRANKQSLNWLQLAPLLNNCAQKKNSALARLQQDYSLSAPELLTLSIVGEVEACHIVNLAVAALQQPDNAARPSLHLIHALLEHLFPDQKLTVFDIAEQALITEGFIQVVGDGPLPQRYLALDPTCWSTLCGRPCLWPSSQALNKLLKKEAIQNAITENSEQLNSLATYLTDDSLSKSPVLVLRGTPGIGRQQLAINLAKQLNKTPLKIHYSVWRDNPAFAILCRYANWLPVVEPDIEPGRALVLPERDNQSPLIVIAGTDGAVQAKHCIEIDIALPSNQQRQQLWRQAIKNKRLAKELADSALLGPDSICNIAQMAQQIAAQKNEKLDKQHIGLARRKIGAEKLRLLAQPVERFVTAESLVMPSLVHETLAVIVKRAHQRESLCSGLGCTMQATANPGLRALFVGESGTGKTLAASFIATELGAPLYRVDLSAVMNKYIGESEKNLGQLLDYAAANDVVLLFDEADALFGSRTEGKETGERFANMLTNFLLTRIENHPGVVLLTTNASDRIDNAFNRRIDVVVEFPLPGYQERLSLWRSHVGSAGPNEACIKNLASYCNFAGGQIRNAVLTAAVFAQGKAISNEHIWQGLRAEYNKIGGNMPSKLNYLRTDIGCGSAV